MRRQSESTPVETVELCSPRQISEVQRQLDRRSHRRRHRRQHQLQHQTLKFRNHLFILVTAAAATAAMGVLAAERKLQANGRVIFKFLRRDAKQYEPALPAEIRCSHHDNLLYAIPNSGCSSYYRCYQRTVFRHRCNEKSVFDFYQQKCVRSEATCYEPVCTGRTNGLYPDTTQGCRRSYECQGGVLIAVENCPHGFRFSGGSCVPPHEAGSCDSPATSAIAIPFDGDNRCYGLQNGNHIIDDDHCKKFMICQDNSVIEVLECPYGYVYDELTMRCVFTGGIESSGCMTNYMDEVDDACARLPGGFHLDPTSKSCTSYIKCANGRLESQHDCPKGSVFNGVQCVPQFLYHCPRLALPGDICERKLDGLHIDPRKGCAFYVRCNNHRTIDSFSCRSSFHYNPEDNMCVDRSRSSEICHEVGYSSDCTQRSAGFYQDFSEASKCSYYFYCFNGNKTALRCPPGQVFDGENCVPSSSYSCPSTASDSCVNKPSGYYRDPSGGCRSYFYCSTDGTKTSYLCNAGQIFSAGHCVDRLADDICSEDLVCAGRSDGYYQDLTSNCRSYFYCQQGEKLQTLTCRGSRLFNGHSCVSQDAYTCPHEAAIAADPLLNCIPRPCEQDCSKNGFQNDYDSGCRDYFFCIDGKKTTLSCSDGQVFNGEICVHADKFPCPKYCDATVACN
ncbi:uncharacterized protein LOC120418434 isoform X1 [Culex pipiens pallens]|uniref:uncharacterized protein LOC120418434 isoform X1 n=1 Tax=Culex pipiens pallens TaxID=42434 RepID=UPI001954EC56|nr:uncharacterized protein LOC120418434 isoform X1 [Culex pipiens pallens]